MTHPPIFADFNNIDPDGCVRLNTVGTHDALALQGIRLEAGMRLEVGDGDLRATIVVRAPGIEGVWRGEIVDGPHDEVETT
jgi:hypothetical protein